MTLRQRLLGLWIKLILFGRLLSYSASPLLESYKNFLRWLRKELGLPQPQSPKPIWSQSQWYDTQALHAVAGAYILVAAQSHDWNRVWTWIIFAVVTALKEFVIDLSNFEEDSVWGSMQDFFFYQLGALSGFFTVTHFWRGEGILIGAIVFLFLADFFLNRKARSKQ